MKFAIISDTHDNLATFKRAADFLEREHISLVLHCGDICVRETRDEMVRQFAGEIHFVRGNNDLQLPEIPEQREIELDGKKIAWVHYPHIAHMLAESRKYDLVFYGHTHKPWEERVGSCRLANPGELAGQRFRPTFAVYDMQTERLELKLVAALPSQGV